MKLTFLDMYESYKPFREYEIWLLFKVAAFSEAFGWLLLIYGILAHQYHLYAHSWALAIGGSVHGMIFIAYLLLVLAGYSSLGWSRLRTLVAIIASVIPCGTVVFEQWAARRRVMTPSASRQAPSAEDI